MNRIYVAIDLKSFYASVECVSRGLDPLTTNLVVADKSRTEKTICLAVSPSLKSCGISGRARLYEVVERVNEINMHRKRAAGKRGFTGSSANAAELARDKSLALDYIIAPPRMASYVRVSSQIYSVYLKYVAPEDIFAYSIDEVFIDATSYLETYKTTPEGFASMLVRDVLKTTGITATAGIGTNMYLCKIAMDIVAKHIPADKDGVRIAFLDEEGFKRKLWDHRPMTDFWRTGRGTAARLESIGIHTMGELARASLDKYLSDSLYKMFGKNAELIIDHAWGYESTTLADVRSYRPETNSLSTGQVLTHPTEYSEARLILWEMADALALDLTAKGLCTDRLVVTVNYDIENLRSTERRGYYSGEIVRDFYGRETPKHAHGTRTLGRHTSSSKALTVAVLELFDSIIDRELTVRRLCIAACGVISEQDIPQTENVEQLSFFGSNTAENLEARVADECRERKLQLAVIGLKRRYGKNAVLKGSSFLEGATARERNRQIGGHSAGEEIKDVIV
ncbi:MAG: DNA methylase [Ruminococcus sp.]|nr:DNA methylase [Ruminococcus sp.]